MPKKHGIEMKGLRHTSNGLQRTCNTAYTDLFVWVFAALLQLCYQHT